MAEISRKDFLAKNLTRMQKMFPEDYNFFPATFTMPGDANLLRDFVKSKKGKTKLTMIVKPSVGCQGKGIYLASSIDKINTSEVYPHPQSAVAPVTYRSFSDRLRRDYSRSSCRHTSAIPCSLTA